MPTTSAHNLTPAERREIALNASQRINSYMTRLTKKVRRDVDAYTLKSAGVQTANDQRAHAKP